MELNVTFALNRPNNRPRVSAETLLMKTERGDVFMHAKVGVVAPGVCLMLAACSIGSITADTTCSDYLNFNEQERHDAAVRISSELGVQDGGNPMWGLSLDAACGGTRDMTIRQYFRQ